MEFSQIATGEKKLIGIPKGLSVIYKEHIPHHWNQDVLSNQATVEYGISTPLNRSLKSGMRILSMPNVNVKGEFVLDDIPFVESEKVKPKNILKEGDLLFNWRNGSEKHVGKTAFFDLKGTYTHVGFLLRIRMNGSVDSFFLYSYLNFIREKGYFTKSKIQVNNSFNKEELLNLPIIFPPLPEQKKIAKTLTSWDDAIEHAQKLVEQLEFRKKGLMQQLLTGKTRLKGFDGEWEEKNLGDYFTQRSETNQNGLPLLSVGINGVYPQGESIKKDTSNSDKSKYKRICIGDIGYNTMRMWQGRSALSELEGIVSPAYTIVTPKQNTDSLFFSYVFKLNSVVHKFYRNSQGLVSDTWQCRFKDFSIVKVDCPPTLAEQQAIAKVLTSADAEIDAQEIYLQQLQEQKKGLMQQLLTGQKRVNVDPK